MATKKRKQSLEEKLVDLMDISNPTITTLYGRPGTGKTTIGSTWPKPELILDIRDNGTESAKSKNLQRGEITVCRVTDFDEAYEVYDYLVKNKEFKSVVIDHMTALQSLALEKVKEEEGKTQISQRMYGIAAGYMNEVIGLYVELADIGILPCFLVQDRMERGDDTEAEGGDQLTPEVGPGLMPSVAKTLGAASRVIGHTYLQEKVEKLSNLKVKRTIEYRLRLGPNPYYMTKVTKSKTSYCPPYLVDASYQDIEKIIKGGWKDPIIKGKKRKRTTTAKRSTK
jgi:hypothetical protein